MMMNKKTTYLIALVLVSALLLAAQGRKLQEPIIVDFVFAAAADFLAGTSQTNHTKDAYTTNKFGFNTDADTSAEESVWDAAELGGPARCFVNMDDICADPDDPNDVLVDCTDPGAIPGFPLRVSSSSALDAGLPIEIEVIDHNWARRIISTTLGAAAVTSGTAYKIIEDEVPHLRVNRAYATTTEFTGHIYIHIDTTDTGTNGIPDVPADQIIAVITAGENQTLQACVSIPAGMDALMTQFCAGNISNVGSADFRIRRAVEGGADRTTEIVPIAAGGYACTVHDPPIRFLEKSDIELTVLSGANNADVSGTFDLITVSKALQ